MRFAALPRTSSALACRVTNEGSGTVDAATLVITDSLPTDMALFVDTSGDDPIVFTDGAIASGLTFTYATDVTFSNQGGGGPPFTYPPVPDATGFDPAVTGFRIAPAGTMNAASGGNNPSFDLQFQLRVQ